MEVRDQRLSLPPWLWTTAIWLGIALFDATQTVFGMRAEGMHHAWGYLFLTTILSWLPWALATPWIVSLGRRFPPVHVRPLSTWARHAGASLAIGVAASGWSALMQHALNPYLVSAPQPFLRMWGYKVVYGLLSSVILYAFILMVSFMLDAQQRLALQETEKARLNEQLSKAQLNALRRQIEPHFLFNSLNAIAGLVRENRNDAAVGMIARLSDFLRRTVEDSHRQEVPLGEEIDFVQKYLDIQKVRFAERLQLSMEVPKELLPAQVPALILQPLVENAVKHGIAKRIHGGALRISAFRQNGTLTLRVYNDGPSLPAECETCEGGVGLANVRTRLQSLYGEHFEFSIRNQSPDGVETSVSVPFRQG
jgi:two-component system, LytTR family, sensor kinase